MQDSERLHVGSMAWKRDVVSEALASNPLTVATFS